MEFHSYIDALKRKIPRSKTRDKLYGKFYKTAQHKARDAKDQKYRAVKPAAKFRLGILTVGIGRRIYVAMECGISTGKIYYQDYAIRFCSPRLKGRILPIEF